MTDLVERLRTRYKIECRRCQHFNCDMTTPHEVMDAAADEIERLRSWRTEFAAAYRTLHRTRPFPWWTPEGRRRNDRLNALLQEADA